MFSIFCFCFTAVQLIDISGTNKVTDGTMLYLSNANSDEWTINTLKKILENCAVQQAFSTTLFSMKCQIAVDFNTDSYQSSQPWKSRWMKQEAPFETRVAIMTPQPLQLQTA